MSTETGILMAHLGSFWPGDRTAIERRLRSREGSAVALDAIKAFVTKWERAD